MASDPLKSKERISEELRMPGYYERARKRAQLRKNPWNNVPIVLMFLGIPCFSYLFFHGMWFVHTLFYPEHADQLDQFWQKGLSFKPFASSFLLVVPLFFASIPIALIFGNCFAWCIPPARHAMEKEAKGRDWMTYSGATRPVLKFAKVLVPMCVFLSFIGAITLKHLR